MNVSQLYEAGLQILTDDLGYRLPDLDKFEQSLKRAIQQVVKNGGNAHDSAFAILAFLTIRVPQNKEIEARHQSYLADMARLCFLGRTTHISSSLFDAVIDRGAELSESAMRTNP